MRCFNCGNNIDKGDICRKCGEDVGLYKRFLGTANLYYNHALEKAKERDLTGAIEDLKNCLSLNKQHINARNLLGLIYCEMGEKTLALKEWTISRRYKIDGNVADLYLDEFQAESLLADIDECMKLFNKSLWAMNAHDYVAARNNLRKVITLDSHMVKALNLLALIYIRENNYDRAMFFLNKVLRIDKGYPEARKYQDEIKQFIKTRKPQRVDIDNELLEGKIADPKNFEGGKFEGRTRNLSNIDFSSYFVSSVCIVIGLVLGIFFMTLIWKPSAISKMDDKYQDTIRGYEEKLATLDSDILQQQIDDLQRQLENTNQSEPGVISAYESLVQSMQLYVDKDYINAKKVFDDIQVPENIDFQKVYSQYAQVCSSITSMLNQQGNIAFEKEDYPAAINNFRTSLELDSNNPQVIYYTGVCYVRIGDQNRANQYFTDVIERFPDSDFVASAKSARGY